MTKIYASLKLRPTRIGFLVRPNDRAAVRRIMRLCACLWGGAFNPIIPVAKALPRAWKSELEEPRTGLDVAEGYLRFFEPDVFVEAKKGLAGELGIEHNALRLNDRIVELDEFIREEGVYPGEPAFGLSVFDLYQSLYQREFRFVPKREQPVAFFEASARPSDNAFIEAAFGMFPSEEDLHYVEQAYLDAFDPVRLRVEPDNWVRAIKSRMETPLRIGRKYIELEPSRRSEPVVFVLNPSNTMDLVDLWNIRQFRRDVFPVHVKWIASVAEILSEIIEARFRPIRGNPFGTMHRTTIEFARSIPPEKADTIWNEHFSCVPKGSALLKCWYDDIWSSHYRDNLSERPKRLQLNAGSKKFEHSVSENDFSMSFSGIRPDFADRFRGRQARWANVLTMRDYASDLRLAMVLPSNMKNPAFPRRLGAGGTVCISREGIVLLQQYVGEVERLSLMRGSDAFIEWLELLGIHATPSSAGRTAEEVVGSLGWMHGWLLEDAETLKLLDKMANSVRGTANVAQWKGLIQRRGRMRSLPPISLDRFTKAGILQLGIGARCPHCTNDNWYSLRDVDYRISCERCLREFDFPQGSLNPKYPPWRYRVIGPFSARNFAEGAYATALTLRVFAHKLSGGESAMTCAMGLELSCPHKVEVDFALWSRSERLFAEFDEPFLVLGEAKSFADQAFGPVEIEKAGLLGSLFPGAFLVLSSLKDSLSTFEKKELGRLAIRGRVPLKDGRPRSPIIVLTATELLATRDVEAAWKQRGGMHARVISHPSVRLENLWTLADLTQQIYLDLPSYHEWLTARDRTKRRRQKG
jgi:hypothetical protein